MSRHSKVVKVSYGLFNNPNDRAIEKAIDRWTAKGYRLASRQEDKPGFLTQWFTAGLARGKTVLTFVKD